MWKDAAIRTKILLSFLVLLLVMLLPCVYSLYSQNRMVSDFSELSKYEHLETSLIEREVDHLKWVQALAAFLINEKEKELKLQTDFKMCAFGKWYYGEGRKAAESVFPQLAELLKEIEEPHAKLHASAAKILQLRAKGEQDKLIEVYFSESVASLGQVQAKLKEIREVISAKIKKESEAIYAANQKAQLLSYVSIGLAVLIAIVCGLLTALSITAPLKRCVVFALDVAAGKLDAVLVVRRKDETGVLAGALNQMLSGLKSLIGEAQASSDLAHSKTREAESALLEAEQAKEQAEQAKAEGMLDAARQLQGVVEVASSASEVLAAQIEQSSRGSEEQARRMTETATAMEEMNATVFEVAKNASQAAETADRAKDKAKEGFGVVAQVVKGIDEVQTSALELKSGMTELGEQAAGIGRIMNVISDIADQTNLLALNAAIEAARAGEAGRGFAVVADEVRKLAEKTMTATKQVGEAIRGIQEGARKNIDNVEQAVVKIDLATGLANESGGALNEIVSLVDLTTDQVRSIATASEQQSATSEEINRSIEDVNRISSETSEGMKQSALAVGELAHQAQVLKNLIDEMKEEGGETSVKRVSNSKLKALPGQKA